MDDNQRKKRMKRINNIREIVKTERKIYEVLTTIEEYYQKPLRLKFKDKYEFLFEGLDHVKVVSDTVLSSLENLNGNNKDYCLRDCSEEFCMKSKLSVFVKQILSQNIKLYKPFLMHITQNVEFMNSLNKKDQLYKWIEEKRLEVLKKDGFNLQELASYLDTIMKRPGNYTLLLDNILNNTHESHPDYQELRKEIALLKDIVKYDLQGALQNKEQEKIMSEILVKMKPQADIRAVACSFQRKGNFLCLERVGDQVEEIDMLFVLFERLLLYGVFDGGEYQLHGRFYLSDSEVELDDNVIVLQDHEKCIYFFSVDNNSASMDSRITEEWYNEIKKRIAEQRTRQVTCGICGHLCCLEFDEKAIQRFSTQNVQGESIPAVECAGCGRAICSFCIKTMKREMRPDAIDKTRFCLHCRNNEKRGWEPPNSQFQVNPAENVDEEWMLVCNDKQGASYIYNRRTKEVMWSDPRGDRVDRNSTSCDQDDLRLSSYVEQKNAKWLMFRDREGRDYYWDKETNDVVWTMKSNVACKDHFCPNCGFSSDENYVSCPECKRLWRI